MPLVRCQAQDNVTIRRRFFIRSPALPSAGNQRCDRDGRNDAKPIAKRPTKKTDDGSGTA